MRSQQRLAAAFADETGGTAGRPRWDHFGSARTVRFESFVSLRPRYRLLHRILPESRLGRLLHILYYVKAQSRPTYASTCSGLARHPQIRRPVRGARPAELTVGLFL